MPETDLLTANDSALLVVDMQTRLLPALAAPDRLRARVRLLLQAAARLSIPALATEQYPAGLGHTDPGVAELLPAGAVVEKTAFAAADAPGFADRIAGWRGRRVVVCGAEAHVCVLQTALRLHAAGHRVCVVADAVSTRRAEDRERALARLQGAGLDVVTVEMVVFEWLERADTEVFRDLAPLIKAG